MKRRQFFLRITAAALAALFILGLCSCKARSNEFSTLAMGNVLTAKIYGDKGTADEIFNAVSEKAEFSDACLSATKPDSDISKINENGRAEVDAHTLRVLMDSTALCNICNRSTDITIGAVSELWGFATDSPKKPADSDISTALKTVGMDGLLIDEKSSLVSVSVGQRLDLGAFGKGAALDEAYSVLSSGGLPAVISLGGTVLAYGKAPSDGAWKIGVRNPFGTANDYFAVLKLSAENTRNAVFVSTSGSYEKSFEYNGKSYHHILSPETGYPVETQLVSVTVVSESGLTSDGLSTACFVNGMNDTTLGWLSSFGAEAVFVFSDGKYFVTDGLKDSFTLTAENGFYEGSY